MGLLVMQAKGKCEEGEEGGITKKMDSSHITLCIEVTVPDFIYQDAAKFPNPSLQSVRVFVTVALPLLTLVFALSYFTSHPVVSVTYDSQAKPSQSRHTVPVGPEYGRRKFN
jgi:hypothetical protein